MTEDMPKGPFFYAVHTGFKPGVYKTWDECKCQVDKFPCAKYKKFAVEQDALDFVRGQLSSTAPAVKNEATSVETIMLPKRGPEALEYIPLGKKRPYEDVEQKAASTKRLKGGKTKEASQKDTCASSKSKDGFEYMGDGVVVYTDGCCTSNGKKGARAGIGVYWGRNHPLNVAERLQGRQTNQRAELQAACKALEQAIHMDIKKLVLFTDSKFTINGVTSWVKNWKKNGWRTTSGGPVTNKEDFQKLDELNGELEVVWMHIPGHAGYLGNEEADRLSREGAAQPYIRNEDDIFEDD